MTKKEKKKLIRTLVFTVLLVGGVIFLSSHWSLIKEKKPSSMMEMIKEEWQESDPARKISEILGISAEREKSLQETKVGKEEQETQVESLRGKVGSLVIKSMAKKVIELLKTLPSEEFEKVKKELYPELCK